MNSQIVKLASTNRDAYLAKLLDKSKEAASKISSQSWLQELRDRASAFVQEQTFPTTRDEEWRFTDLSPLLEIDFVAAPNISLSDITPLILPEAAESRLVFVNGIYAPNLSSISGIPDGVFVGNLLSDNIPAIQDYLGKQPGAEEVFTALNTAAIADAAVVWIPKNLDVTTPIHLLFISSPGSLPTISQPRCLVVAEKGSNVTLIEDYLYQKDTSNVEATVYFTNAVTEIWVGENAEVKHNIIERDSQTAFHIGKTAIAQSRNSRYSCNAISLGGKISRHNLEVFQTGEGTQTTINGLTTIAGEQLADTHSAIALNHPNGNTRQLHKCIIADKGHAVFNGKVFVPKLAQLTDAGQLNRNLLLSPKARVDTKPQLEITADNVKCSHGATVSQLEPEEVFYLQSRGLNEHDSRNLLINAFAAEIINELPLVSLRELLFQAVKNIQSF